MAESSQECDELFDDPAYDPYEEITFSSEEDEDSFHSEQRNLFKKLLRYNRLLKNNIQDILPEAINAGHILHVIPKYGDNVLTVSDIEKVQSKLKNEGQTEAVVELLNRLVIYKDWFTVFLKCLADRHVNQEFLVDVLKKIEAEVHNEVYRDDSKKCKSAKYVKPLQRLKDFFFKKRPNRYIKPRLSDKSIKRPKYQFKRAFRRKKSPPFRYLTSEHIDQPEHSPKVQVKTNNYQVKSDPLFSSCDLFEKCPCELESVVNKIKDIFNSQRKERYREILSSLIILLNEIRSSIHGMRSFELKFMKQNLPGLLVNISRLCVTKSLNISFLQIKQTTFEIIVYLTNSSPEYCHIFLKEDIIGAILYHLQDDKLSKTELLPSDIDKKDTLLQIKRDSIIILLTLARMENCKNKLFSLRPWMEHYPPFSIPKNKFVKDLTLLLYAYLWGKKHFLHLLADMGTTLDMILGKLLSHLKFYTDYNPPSNRHKIEANIYIEGMAHLASIGETVFLTQPDSLLTLQKIVQKLDDKTINTAYVHLLCNIELPQLIERQTLQCLASVSSERDRDPYQTDVKFTDESDQPPENLPKYSDVISYDLELLRLNSKDSGESYFQDLCDNISVPSIDSGFESKNSMSLHSTMKGSITPTVPQDKFFNTKLSEIDAQATDKLLQLSNKPHGFLQADSPNQPYCASSITGISRCSDQIPENKTLKNDTVFKEMFGEGHFCNMNKRIFYINAGFSAYSARTNSFLKEVEMINVLDCLSIIQFLAETTASGPCHINLKLLPSGSLNQFFQTNCGMKLLFSDVIRLNVQIARGMAYLEEKKIALRDLRAEKILVGDHLTIKISDFEYAVQLENEDSIYVVEHCEGIPVRCTSPEAALDKKFSLKSDVWSFGVVMYETVTLGGVPYSGYSNEMIMSMLQEGRLMEKPEKGQILVPDFYFNTMLECWERMPEKRPKFHCLHKLFISFLTTT